jgi:hypothetical protein
VGVSGNEKPNPYFAFILAIKKSRAGRGKDPALPGFFRLGDLASENNREAKAPLGYG